MGILASIAILGYDRVRARVEGVKCAANMRTLYTSLSTYIQERGNWPQEPEYLQQIQDDKPYEDWWIETLEPYGASEEVWKCPSIKRRILAKSPTGRPRLSYDPTMFDKEPFTPYKWPKMPWLLERGNNHGGGGLCAMPDGSIITVNDLQRR